MVRAEASASVQQLFVDLSVNSGVTICGAYGQHRLPHRSVRCLLRIIGLATWFVLFLHILGNRRGRGRRLLTRNYHRRRCRALFALRQAAVILNTITYTTTATAANTTTTTASIAANATRHAARSCSAAGAAASFADSFAGLIAAAAAAVSAQRCSRLLFFVLFPIFRRGYLGLLPTGHNVHIPRPQTVEHVLLFAPLPIGRIDSMALPAVSAVQR